MKNDIQRNLGWGEVLTRIATLMLGAIPVMLFNEPYFIVISMYLLATALVGWCPIKAIWLNAKAANKPVQKRVSTPRGKMNPQT